MTFKLSAPFLHDADGRHGRGVAERTEGSPKHVFGKVRDEIDVFLTPQTGVEALQGLPQPSGTFPARNAPSAGFVGVEVHDAPRHVHHAGVFVHHHHAAGTEHRARFRQRIVIHRDIDLLGGQQRTGTSAGNDRLQFFPFGDAARHFVNELLHVHAERNFINPRLPDMTGDA